MSRCLCCGKELGPKEETGGWHGKCIRRFFGTEILPEIAITEETIRRLVTESTNRGFTVPGVQKKMSLHLETEDKPRLTLVNYPTGYILKPQTEEYGELPENEFLIMQMAVATKIRTVPFALMRTQTSDGKYAYITRRIDREKGQILAMEDFCQLDGRLTEDKYRGSYERCANVIARYSAAPMLDLSELFLRIVFSFAVGNSDMHLKNFSLIETKEGSSEFTLSAAYDMLSTNLAMPRDKEELALPINGKKSNIRKIDFLQFAGTTGLPEKAARKMIAKVAECKTMYQEMCLASYLSAEAKERLCSLIEERMARLA